MGFLSLLEVASMPVVQVLLIGTLGAFMATDYLNLLCTETRKSLNKIVFAIFTPALMFASLSKTVTFQDLINWWFMFVNVGLIFFFGGLLAWIAIKLLKPRPHLEGLIMATCASGNLGNLLLIIIPAICNEDGGPFGDNHEACSSLGLSYASLSMALGGFFIWTYCYQLIKNSALKHKVNPISNEIAKRPNKDLDGDHNITLLLEGGQSEKSDSIIGGENERVSSEANSSKLEMEKTSTLISVYEFFKQILMELMAPPTFGALIGFVFGSIPWLRDLLVGKDAPLRVIQDSIKLLGDGTIPCITLILGGNLVQGLRSSSMRKSTITAVVCIKCIFLPMIGIGVVKVAGILGFLPADPLYRYVLMIQFVLPPAMNISTMTQLFDIAQEECSVLFLWTYLMACVSITVWSTVFIAILS
ncbi:protein PIN-LIKES 7-like [Impatiens glandulifera]|uniref:protein PIN-LIKES 7-like n=1 Tax=Impatiens glandulifera TaxID=253017 RepID=UPI001FB05505|nr:protein PIN-LIKES 7-like [Impatiens glandulifera]XP_047318100.1 protein PIN-LIKES 7-like [Impatiens glandulifera]